MAGTAYADMTPGEKKLSAWGGPLVLLLTAGGIALAVFGPDVVVKLKIIAVSAGALGAAGALVSLLAHNGSDVVDGFGKMLGFSAALLAGAAAVVLFWVELTIA